jgi:alanine racemase
MSGRLRVDLAALQSNYRSFQQAGRNNEVGAVVKADAYGLGCTEIARALAAVGCQAFFVATLQEGVQLRSVLVEPDIFVLAGIAPGSVDTLVSHRLTPVINDPVQLEAWRGHQQRPIAVHVDTGMSRLGFPENVEPAVFAGFTLALLMSHFASADEPDSPQNDQQIAAFRRLAARFPGVRTSLGSSAAWLRGEAFQGDLGRPGIGLYGGRPFGYQDCGDSLVPGCVTRLVPEVVARFEAQVLQVREVAAGASIGYGASYLAEQDLRIAIVGCGYADGVPRRLSNRGSLAFGERLCPIVGRVSMDMTGVDISDFPNAPEPGDWLEIFGDVVSVDQVAQWAETISYEVFTGIRPRVARHYHWG